MATGLPDYYALSFIQEQAALLYFERVYQEVVGALTISEERLIPLDANMYIKDAITVDSDGRLWCLGTIYILTD